MPLMRNPFRRAPGDFHNSEEHGVPVTTHGAASDSPTASDGSYQKPGLFASFSPKPLKIPAQGTDKEPAEYKLCEIDRSGVFMPPSPTTEKATFWGGPRSATSRTSSYRSVATPNENEPFNMSRESFDSYRRSFDICARSPVLEASNSPRPRQSLDSRSWTRLGSNASTTAPHMPRISPPRLPDMFQPSLRDNHVNPPSSLEEDIDGESEEDVSPRSTQSSTMSSPEEGPFVDVGLQEERKLAPKKRSFFSRFGESSAASHPATNETAHPNSSNGHHSHSISIFSRKRGISGQGAELGSISDRPNTTSPGAPLASAS